MNNKTSLRNEFMRFCIKYSHEDQIENLKIISNIIVNFIKEHHFDSTENFTDMNGKLFLQMMLTKVLSLVEISKGISIETYNNIKLDNVVDPTILSNLIRNIFETAGLFNLIYRSPKSKNEKEIIFMLWAIAGLSYRQNLDDFNNIENIEKKEKEKKQIDDLKRRIFENQLYINLDNKNKDIINTRIKSKEFLIQFDSNKVTCLKWSNIINNFSIKHNYYDKIYNWFSQYSHPSYVSVFQFGQMYSNEEVVKGLTRLNLRIAIDFLSFFVSDYVYLFPETIKTFEKFKIIDQIVINFNNMFYRGENYIINNSLALLED